MDDPLFFHDILKNSLFLLAIMEWYAVLVSNKNIKNYSYQNISIIKVCLFIYSSMKKKIRKIRLIFDIENDVENQNCATFDPQLQIDLNT